MEARPRLVKRLSAMWVFAEVRQELQAEEHVLVAVRSVFDVGVGMAVMVVV